MASGIDQIVAALKATSASLAPRLDGEASAVQPFVTVARQAGTDGVGFARDLVRRLVERDGDDRWRTYDRDLVEEVSTRHEVSSRVVAALEDEGNNWLKPLLQPFIYPDRPSDLKLFHHVAGTILGIARAGHAVIVGRGGAFITRHLPGGVHVYLCAPFEDRVKNMADRRGLDPAEAARVIREVDENRQRFYRSYFRDQAVGVEAFTITLNRARLERDALTGAAMSVIPGAKPAYATA